MLALNSLALRAAAVAGLVGIAGTAQATEDWQAAAATCVPVSAGIFHNTLTGVPGAHIRPTLGNSIKYYCNVLSPQDAVPTPTWAFLELQYQNDSIGGNVTAQLYAKDKVTGATVAVGPAAVSTASIPVNVVAAVLPAAPLLDFAVNAYHVLITVVSTNDLIPRAHMVVLTD